jgi:hypothetical protein
VSIITFFIVTTSFDNTNMNFFISLTFLLLYLDISFNETSVKNIIFDYYNRCEQGPWLSWSYCSETCGGGQRNRNRTLSGESCLLINEFQWMSEYCNTHCLNDGKYMTNSYSGYCQCKDLYEGRCCGERMFIVCV